MAARKKRLTGDRKKKIPRLAIYLTLISLVFASLKIGLKRDFWDGREKLTLVVRDKAGGVRVSIFDPKLGEINSLSIPSETEIEVAKNLGIWKLVSVWELGYQEGVGGELVARSLTNHLKLPVSGWAEAPALGFSDGDPTSLIKAITTSYDTNLKLGDKLSLGIFSFLTGNIKRSETRMEDTSFLSKGVLTDGSSGFHPTGEIPKSVASFFVDPQISDSSFTILVKDASGEVGIVDEVSQIFEVLGGKVTSVNRLEPQEFYCQIQAKDFRVRRLIHKLFNCVINTNLPEENFDLEMTIGKAFAQGF